MKRIAKKLISLLARACAYGASEFFSAIARTIAQAERAAWSSPLYSTTYHL